MRAATRRALLSRPAAAAAAAFVPTDLASLTAWWDFSDATTLYTDAGSTLVSGDGDLIYQPNDKSGGGLHLTQATSGARPTYKTAIQNGLSVARLAGLHWWTRASMTGSDMFGANTGTLFFVQKQNGATAHNTTISLECTTSTNYVHVHATYENVIYFDFGSAAGGGRISVAQPSGWDDAWRITCLHRDGANGKIYVDGGTAILSTTFSDDFDDTASGTLHVGQKSDSNKFGGDFGELITFDAALSTADLNAVGDYLAAKWSLTWNTVS